MSDSPPPIARDELVAMVFKAHHGATYAESTEAGKALAEQSKLPRIVAHNLGAGFGQWDFFPEATEMVDFALTYVAPASEDDVWTMARAWASDDAAKRHTMLALLGRDILQHELRRIEVPKLRELIDETRADRAHELRLGLGLAVPAVAPAPKVRGARKAAATGAAPGPKREIPTRMPKPAFVPPKKAAAAPPARRFGHPKFGEGPLERQEGEGPDAKLTVKFPTGSKTLLARFLTEVP